jgi:hypothetical protein
MLIKRKKEPIEKTQWDIYKEQGEVNRFGVKILPTGEQWVIDAKTGKPTRRENYECFSGNNGLYLWVKKGELLSPLNVPFPSVWDIEKKES